jgi:hypothetical protein
MMKHRVLAMLSSAILCSMFALATPRVAFAQECQPGRDAAYQQFPETYDLLIGTLTPHLGDLTTLLDTVADETSYQALKARAIAIADGMPGLRFRVLVTVPDGTVVVDTRSQSRGSTYNDFLAKAVNENHNSRIAIVSAQLFPCGAGIESKLSTSSGTRETYFAARLGAHLNSAGTARISLVQ